MKDHPGSNYGHPYLSLSVMDKLSEKNISFYRERNSKHRVADDQSYPIRYLQRILWILHSPYLTFPKVYAPLTLKRACYILVTLPNILRCKINHKVTITHQNHGRIVTYIV